MSYLFLVTIFVLKFVLPEISISNPALFWLLFACISFHSITIESIHFFHYFSVYFNQFVFEPKVSLIDSTQITFFILSINLSLLNGMSNLFILSIITHMVELCLPFCNLFSIFLTFLVPIFSIIAFFCVKQVFASIPLKFFLFSLNKCSLDCCKPLVNLQSSEKVDFAFFFFGQCSHSFYGN